MAEGQPTGPALATGTTDGNTLPAHATLESREVSLGAGVALTSGTKYAIEVKAPDVAGNQLLWLYDDPGTKANGSLWESENSGSSWTEGSEDCWFQTKAAAVVKDSHAPGDSAVNLSTIRNAEWSAQTFTAGSSYTITSVVLRMNKFFAANTIGTVTVSIKATEPGLPGKATTPVPGNTDIDIRRNLLTTGWATGADTDSFDVYFGLEGAPVLQESAYVPTSWTIGGMLLYNTVYEWRVDSNNAVGTTTGDTWKFTILVFAPPLPSGVTLTGNSGPNGEGTATGTPTGVNNVITVKRLVAVADDKLWFEDL